ncbi:hypothetical protein GCM10009733_088600 [Nonomuraea maheshkhaliensis]|uniref:Uncharacterized protein n=1 Tax=Nonomuraea maheshkhaliensis TaxID=419590 RepID=A0ABP4STX9_9ACTN
MSALGEVDQHPLAVTQAERAQARRGAGDPSGEGRVGQHVAGPHVAHRRLITLRRSSGHNQLSPGHALNVKSPAARAMRKNVQPAM